MVVTIALDVAAMGVVAAIVPVFVSVIGPMIIRSILGADYCRRQSGHGEGCEGK